MNTQTEIVRAFYTALAAGNAPGALALMSDDIEWNTMWHYKVDGPGPQGVADGVLKPLMAEWATFKLQSTEFLADGEIVVSLGRFTGVHGTTLQTVDAAYAHVWTVRDGRIQRFRQYIDTLAVAEARA